MKDRIKELRSVLNLSQKDFANSIAVQQSAVSMMERGTLPVSDRVITTICLAHGIDEHWLRTGEGDMYPAPSDDDAELMNLMAMLTTDDMDPERKRLVIAFCRVVMSLPEYALDPTREYFERMTDAYKSTKKEEE